MEAKTKKSLLWIVVAVVMAIVLFVIYVAVAKPQFWRMMRDDIPHYKWLNYGDYDYGYQGIRFNNTTTNESFRSERFVMELYEGGYSYCNELTLEHQTKEMSLLQPRVLEWVNAVKEYFGSSIRFTYDSVKLLDRNESIPHIDRKLESFKNARYWVNVKNTDLCEVPYILKKMDIYIDIGLYSKKLLIEVQRVMRLEDGYSYNITYWMSFGEKGEEATWEKRF
ncbi:MAG: hypothetical protein IJF71_05775 [Clostridia bacterium]|nr:hypothetical protein [Clostridia bacterium]